DSAIERRNGLRGQLPLLDDQPAEDKAIRSYGRPQTAPDAQRELLRCLVGQFTECIEARSHAESQLRSHPQSRMFGHGAVNFDPDGRQVAVMKAGPGLCE